MKRRDRLGVRVGDTNVFIKAARDYRASIDLDALQILCLPVIVRRKLHINRRYIVRDMLLRNVGGVQHKNAVAQ